jgi:hypothetical protein
MLWLGLMLFLFSIILKNIIICINKEITLVRIKFRWYKKINRLKNM